jgi:primosomal protein N'
MMLAMLKELVVSLADIRCICVSCQHCKTKVVLDMREQSDFARTHGVFLPNECPGCRKPYDSALQPGLQNLHRAYEPLLPLEKWINFRGDPGIV